MGPEVGILKTPREHHYKPPAKTGPIVQIPGKQVIGPYQGPIGDPLNYSRKVGRGSRTNCALLLKDQMSQHSIYK